jgi:hypothetical protein
MRVQREYIINYKASNRKSDELNRSMYTHIV